MSPFAPLRAALLTGTAALLVGAPLAQTSTPPMVRPVAPAPGSYWASFPLFTVGEVVNGYQPPGILDGIGAWRLNAHTMRFFVNHELGDDVGYPYGINNGQLLLTGARISYVDVDRQSLQIVHAEEAYDQVTDRYGRRVTTAQQINEGTSPLWGFDRFCSSQFFPRGTNGVVDDLYITGEETGDGQAYALDPRTQRLYALPMLGRAAFESVAFVDTGSPATVGVLIGDDRAGAPLYLYIGRKNAAGTGSILDRNGLERGQLHVWVADDGATSPQTFNGTGASRTGRFVRVLHFDPTQAGLPGYDAAGYADMATLDALSAAAGAFQFSRPEDVDTNPADGTQVVFASTGRGQQYPADNWGTTYIVDLAFGAAGVTATLDIVYDGDDAGAGQFTHPDFGLRNPDNLDWARDGRIYVQEDRSTSPGSLFGSVSGMEASMWAIEPATGALTRVGMIDRTSVPAGQTDPVPTQIGNWESSGVVDVSDLFGLPDPITLLMLDVQAHSLRDGVIASNGLVEGGQLLFMLGVTAPSPFAALLRDANPQSLAEALALITGNPTSGAGAPAEALALEAAGPNPFRTATAVRYALAASAPVRLSVVDVLGREVAVLTEGTVEAGSHIVPVDGAGLPAGVYVVRLQTPEGTQTLRLTLAR